MKDQNQNLFQSNTSSFITAVGHSEHVDVTLACEEIIQQIDKQLNYEAPNAGIVYMNIDTDSSTVLTKIKNKWPDIELIGCSSCGGFSTTHGYSDDMIALMVFKSDEIDIVVGIGRDVSKGGEQACIQAIEEINSKTHKPIKLCFTLPESLNVAGDTIVEHLQKNLDQDTLIFGGTASDNYTFTETSQFYNSEILQDSVPIIAFAGDLIVSSGRGSGWCPIGSVGVITKSDCNIVYEINNQSAVFFYQELLGGNSELTGEYCLVILDDNNNEQHFRAPLIFNYNNGSITFSGNLVQGARIQITSTNRDQILEGCNESLKEALDTFPANAKIAGSLIVSCASRKVILSTKAKEEFNHYRSVFKGVVPMLGFYSYGEIATRNKPNKKVEFLNTAFISLLFGVVD